MTAASDRRPRSSSSAGSTICGPRAASCTRPRLADLARAGIATGFGFLGREAGFGIGENLIEYSPASTYGRAIVVGFLNTLKVAFVGCILTTFLGTFLGILRLSSNPLLARLMSGYVE